MRSFRYDEQLLAQPDAVEAALRRAPLPRLDPARPIVLSGIGTSLHAARVAAAWCAELSGGRVRPLAVDAHELALRLPLRAEDQLVVVTHRGTKTFPGQALAKGRAAGALTVAVVGEGAPQPEADYVLRTCPDEKAGTHTVSYLTALATLGRLVAPFGDGRLEAALGQVPALLRKAVALPAPLEAARRLAGREPVLLAGFGLDAITADEGALKLKEATYAWAEGLSIELALHGPPAALRPGMALILLRPAGDDAGRAETLRAVCAELGVEVLECAPEAGDLPYPPCEALVRPLVNIVPLQRLAAEVARLRGSSPDVIHRDVEPWKTAMSRYKL
jgi:glutamine---fructose-6-phosphate transaminase (isomerizing)